jgi:hypothetical protein
MEPYFPIGQAALRLRAEGGKIKVALQTLTPNFKRYEVQLDGDGWKPADSNLAWSVHPGMNRLEARTVNKFGVTGPLSAAEVEVTE